MKFAVSNEIRIRQELPVILNHIHTWSPRLMIIQLLQFFKAFLNANFGLFHYCDFFGLFSQKNCTNEIK